MSIDILLFSLIYIFVLILCTSFVPSSHIAKSALVIVLRTTRSNPITFNDATNCSVSREHDLQSNSSSIATQTDVDSWRKIRCNEPLYPDLIALRNYSASSTVNFSVHSLLIGHFYIL